MLTEWLHGVPPDAVNITLVLALAFFIGLEREEHKQKAGHYAFGGVRTFPLIGLMSYALALIAAPALAPWMIGFAVVGGFMLLSYHYKLAGENPAGLTTEVSALVTYVVAGLVQREQYWIAMTIAIVSVLLLELKKGLENLTARIGSEEIISAAKFLILLAVILPIVPDRDLTRFHLNPFRTWLVVVAVSGVSFASYAVQRLLRERGGVFVSAILGGAYSSTVTSVVLARQSRQENRPNLFAGAILTASGVMYARLVVLLAFFHLELAGTLAPGFCALAVVGGVAGWLVSRRGDGTRTTALRTEAKNPLQLKAALVFAAVFVIVVVLTSLAHQFLGRTGLYSLAALMGITDVDPFILGLAQRGPAETPVAIASTAIVIAAASNNVIKAIYVYAFADRTTGLRSALLLVALAALGLAPLLWL